jgi:hypothetical protein
MRPAWLLCAASALFLMGCPRPVPIGDLELRSLELSVPDGRHYCLERPPQVTVRVNTLDGKAFRTPRAGEGGGNRLRYEDFVIETSHGRVDESGLIVIDDPIPLLTEELVIRARPAGPVGPGTRTPEWVRDELRLSPRFDCAGSISFDGAPGGEGLGGEGGANGADGTDGGDVKNCTAGQHGGRGQNGGFGANGGNGHDGLDARVDLVVATSTWRHRVLVLRSRVAGEASFRYWFVDPYAEGQVVISSRGGMGGAAGHGGRGGNGGDGGDARCPTATPGNGGDGGDGGDGGNGGDGGDGGRLELRVAEGHGDLVERFLLRNGGGHGGPAGQGGGGGNGGRPGTGGSTGFPGKDGQYGRDGHGGRDGNAGPSVTISFEPAADLFANEVERGLQLR